MRQIEPNMKLNSLCQKTTIYSNTINNTFNIFILGGSNFVIVLCLTSSLELVFPDGFPFVNFSGEKRIPSSCKAHLTGFDCNLACCNLILSTLYP